MDDIGIVIMVRIDDLPDGVVFLDNSKYIKDYELPTNIYKRLVLLRASDAGSQIPGIGYRVTDTTYWVYEDDDDDGRNDDDTLVAFVSTRALQYVHRRVT